MRSIGAMRAVGTLAAAGAACVAYGTFIEREWYRFREVTLDGALRPTTRAPKPLRLLHVSDVHLDPPRPKRVAFLREIAQRDYDLVVATGDLLGAQDAEQALVEAMAPLTADGTPGLVVLGSNDIFAPTAKSPLIYFTDPDHRTETTRLDTDAMIEGLEATGWRVLRNEAIALTLADGRRVSVGAIDDPHLNETVIPPPEALELVDPDADLRLGLVHAPYTQALDVLVDTGHDLLLTGHTHGGQVRFPPIGALVANCDLPLDQVRGASRYRDAWLHITPGLGTSSYAPFRFACRPEATLLHLLPSDAPDSWAG